MLLARHAEIVARGGQGITGVLGEWIDETDLDGEDFGFERRDLSPGYFSWICQVGDRVFGPGWNICLPGNARAFSAKGPELGSEGQRLADAAALAAGFALVNPDGLVLPEIP